MLDLDGVELPAAAETTPLAIAPAGHAATMQQIVESSQRQAIRQALGQHHGNWAASARQLGLDASNLHKLAKRVGLKP